MPGYINARGKQILSALLNQSEYLPLKSIERLAGVSRRTVYYDLEKINEWLKQMSLPELDIVREKGVLIPYGQRKRIQELMDESTDLMVYIFSPSERVRCIICYLIYASEPVYIEQLTDCLEVSRNTVLADLRIVESRLEQYELKLEYHAKTGYSVIGDPVRIRALFALYFGQMLSLFTNGTIKFFDFSQIEGYYETLGHIQQELGIDYVEGVLLSLAALIPLSFRHRQDIVFNGLKQEKIQETREFALIQKSFPGLPPDEQLYLTLHLLGSRVNIASDKYFESASKTYVHDLARSLISEFEKVACIIFDDRTALEKALFIHLNSSLYRYRFGIQIGNELSEDVMNEYPEIFAISRIVARRLEEDIGVPIPDSEVAYLALHFGSFLKISGPEHNKIRILIVCANGISTGNMLKREIQKLLPFAEITGVVPAVNLVNAQNLCDLIISTVKLTSVVPVIIVHPVLTEFDRRSILNHRFIASKNVEVQRNKLFKVVKKYIDPLNYDNVLRDLTSYIQDGQQKEAVSGSTDGNGLLDILDIPRVQIYDGHFSWKQSIRMAGQYLVDYRSIEPAYLDTIINQLEFYGPYMFLTDDVILAHAKPEDGVNCLDLSLAIFHEPVSFSQHKKAKLVLILAAVDQEKHLKILQDILALLSAPDSTGQLFDCEASVDVLQTISRII